jgi:hypothetical protein
MRNLPINIAIVFPTLRELFAKLDASKDAFLASNWANKLDEAIHVTRDIDSIADFDLTAVAA